jgi:heme exporter protein A
MNLSALQDRLAQHLSAGQKRRLGLARLLVTGRPVWLLDEPTVSLDAASVALFADVVRAHLARGGSALIATHVDLGLDEAALLDLTAFRAQSRKPGNAFDGAFA